MKPISVIIPCWNADEYTGRCVSLLLNCKSSIDELVLIDNGSVDNTADLIRSLVKKHGAWVKSARNKTNLGFSRAINQGVELSKPGNDLLLLNNDVEIHNPALIGALQAEIYRLGDMAAAIHPRQLNPDGSLLIAESYTLPVTKYGMGVGNQPDLNQYPDTIPVDVAMFSCLYVRRAAWMDIGALDEQIFSYSEDSDWCVRARQARYSVYLAGGLSVVHYHNTAAKINKFDVRRDYQDRSVAYFATKHQQWFDRRYIADLTIQGSTGMATGYSELTMQVMKSLEMYRDEPVRIHYGHLYGVAEFENQSLSPLINDIRRRNPLHGGNHLVIGQGDVFYKNSGDFRMGLSMMDCDRWPAEWVRQANMSLHTLFIPTDQGAMDARESGISVPEIKTCPLGVDPNMYHPGIRPITNYRHIKYRRETNFLSVFQWGERKMAGLLMQAWYRAFHDDPDIALFIKTDVMDQRMDMRAAVAAAKRNYPRAKTTIHVLTDGNWRGVLVEPWWMPSLYTAHDAMILASAGEGFCLPALESLACGVPVGVTGHFGWVPENIDRLKSATLWDWDWHTVAATDCYCPYYYGARWAIPKIDDMVDKLRTMKADLTALKTNAIFDSEYIRRNVTWEKTTDIIRREIVAHGHIN